MGPWWQEQERNQVRHLLDSRVTQNGFQFGQNVFRAKAFLASINQSSKISSAMQALNPFRSFVLELPRSKASADFDSERKQELGQFLTPQSIGSFMASLFDARPAEIRLLDAGAGDGALI